MQSIRIITIPDCKMLSSGTGMFGDGILERFDEWLQAKPQSIFPKDFLYWDVSGETPGFCWLYLYEGGEIPEGFSLVDFKGGLYAVATDIDGQTDTEAMNREKDEFLAANGFERDPTRPELGNIITSKEAEKILGYCQMDYYTPIRYRT